MKLILLLVGIFLLSGYTAKSQMGYEYLLVATHEISETGKNWMCRDYGFIQEKVADKISYDKRRNEIIQKYPGVQTIVKLIKPNEAIVVYEYEKEETSWNCRKRLINIIVGGNIDSCRSKMEKDVVKRPNHYKSQPKSIFERTPISDGVFKASQIWDGIEVKYFIRESGIRDNLVFVQVKNPLKDKAAIIAAFQKTGYNQVRLGDPLYELKLEPGMHGSFSIKPSGDYVLALRFDKPGNSGEKERGIFEWVAGYIRSQVTKKSDDVKIESTNKKDSTKNVVFGVRG